MDFFSPALAANTAMKWIRLVEIIVRKEVCLAIAAKGPP